ncbi:MAG: chloramphenicol phosphotransferase [Verrucomicrobiota bacterium]
MNAIVLNGASSSGKTSIVRSLQRLSGTPLLHASLDTFTDMFDWSSVDDGVRKECHSVGVGNFHRCLPILASGPFPLVVDHVFERQEWFEECFKALKGRRTFFVGVHCPLPVLESREQERGNRRLGLAKSQFERVHVGKDYDLELDTSKFSSEECALAILNEIQDLDTNR